MVSAVTRSFVQKVDMSSVVGDTLTILHMLGSTSVLVYMYSPGGEWFIPGKTEGINSQTVTIDISYLTDRTGIWTVVIGAKSKAAGLGLSGYTSEFTQGDLVDQTYTVVHGLASESVLVAAYDSEGNWFDPKSILVVDENTVDLSFAYGEALSGTWKVVVIGSTEAKGNVRGFSMSFTKDFVISDSFLAIHSLSSTAVVAQVYNGTGEMFWPSGIKTVNDQAVELELQDLPDGFGTMFVTLLAVV